MTAAVGWLQEVQGKSLDEIKAADAKAETDPSAVPADLKPGEEAKSLVCGECGRKLRSHAQAEFHATKTGHVDFSESTEEIAPLTEEEKKAKLEELRRKLAEKRSGVSEQDKSDKKKNEVKSSWSCNITGKLTWVLGDPSEEHQGDTRYQGGSQKEGAAEGCSRKAQGKAR